MLLYDHDGKEVDLTPAEEKALLACVACIKQDNNFDTVIPYPDVDRAAARVPIMEFLAGLRKLEQDGIIIREKPARGERPGSGDITINPGILSPDTQPDVAPPVKMEDTAKRNHNIETLQYLWKQSHSNIPTR